MKHKPRWQCACGFRGLSLAPPPRPSHQSSQYLLRGWTVSSPCFRPPPRPRSHRHLKGSGTVLEVTLGDRPAPSSRRAIPKVSVRDRLYFFLFCKNNTNSQHRGYRAGGGRVWGGAKNARRSSPSLGRELFLFLLSLFDDNNMI